MPTVTYKNQPAIEATKGNVPNSGTKHPYTIERLLWPEDVTWYLATKIFGSSLHVCSGMSGLCDVKLDMYAVADVTGDAARLPFADNAFDTVLCDPPYNGRFQWNHDMLNELHRVADERIIFQHWFSPVNRQRQFKKAHSFRLESLGAVAVEVEDSDVYFLKDLVAWMPRTYFGRMQIISVFDRQEVDENGQPMPFCECGEQMQLVRPGKIQCPHCG